MSSRIRFFVSHLLISLIIALITIGLVFLIWYPYPLAKAVGVTHIFLMMLAIDVIVGPILGFFVYKVGKKTLKVDLAVIILIQLSALLYGVYTIQEGRPVWIAFNIDQFELIRKNEIYDKNIKHASNEFQNPSLLNPKFVAVQFSKDKKQKQQDMFDEVIGGIPISQRPERYIELTEQVGQIRKKAQKLNILTQYNNLQLVQKTLAKYPQATAFVPLKANALDMTVLINKEKGEVVKIVDLRPWK